MNNFFSRIVAYIFDLLIITILLSLISNLVIKNNNSEKLNKELESVEEKCLNGEIEYKTCIYNIADISQDIDRENVYLNIIQGFLIVGYFIILPYCFNGKTLGKKIFKLKIISENGTLDYNKLIIRSLVINGLGYLFISMSLVYLIPSLPYFIVTYFLSFAQAIIIIVSTVMIIKNKKHKGIHDILSGTKVISEVRK